MERFNAADASGEGLDKDTFVTCFATILSDMGEENFAA